MKSQQGYPFKVCFNVLTFEQAYQKTLIIHAVQGNKRRNT